MGSVAARCPPFMALLTFVHKGILNIVARCDQHRPVSTAFDRDQTSDPFQSRPERPSRFCPASGVSVLPLAREEASTVPVATDPADRSRRPPLRRLGSGGFGSRGRACALIAPDCVSLRLSEPAGGLRPARAARAARQFHELGPVARVLLVHCVCLRLVAPVRQQQLQQLQ